MTKVNSRSLSYRKINWLILIAATVLSVLTFLTMRHIDRFEVETEQLLLDDTFTEGKEYWQQKGSEAIDFANGQVTISNTSSASRRIFQSVEVDTPAFYRFSALAEVTDVTPASQEGWALASIAIVQRDQNGKIVAIRNIATISGTLSSELYEEDLLLDKSVATIDYSIRLLRSSGTLAVAEPTVSPLKEVRLYKGARFVVVSAWVILFVFLGSVALKTLPLSQVVLLTLLAVVALCGTLMPGALVTEISEGISYNLPESIVLGWHSVLNIIYNNDIGFNAAASVSKLGHLLVFIGFGFLAGLGWRRYGLCYGVAAIVVFAIATEALQTLVYGRSTSIFDLVLDFTGGALGLVTGVGLLELIRYFKNLINLSPKS